MAKNNFWGIPVVFLCTIAPLLGDSRLFYAKLEPLEHYEFKAAVSGVIKEVKSEKEGSYIDDEEVIVRFDDTLERATLAHQDRMLKSMQERVDALLRSYELAERHFRDVQALSTKSRHQKDSAEIAFFNAKIAYLQALEQLDSLKIERARNLDTITKKRLVLSKRYLYKIHAKAGEYVSTGAPLAEAMDISGAKITLFLSKAEAQEVHKKHFYIDGIATKVRIRKLHKVADSEHISEYRLELEIPAREFFSELVKIEMRD